MLIGVDVDPGESLERISSWAEGNGFFWQLAPVSAQPLKDYRISQQSAAVGIDASGEIVLRKNGGLQGEDKWRDWLTTLLDARRPRSPRLRRRPLPYRSRLPRPRLCPRPLRPPRYRPPRL